jgi:hypothetical protein
MEAVRTSETSVNFNVIMRRYIPEDSKLHEVDRSNISRAEGWDVSKVGSMTPVHQHGMLHVDKGLFVCPYTPSRKILAYFSYCLFEGNIPELLKSFLTQLKWTLYS